MSMYKSDSINSILADAVEYQRSSGNLLDPFTSRLLLLYKVKCNVPLVISNRGCIIGPEDVVFLGDDPGQIVVDLPNPNLDVESIRIASMSAGEIKHCQINKDTWFTCAKGTGDLSVYLNDKWIEIQCPGTGPKLQYLDYHNTTPQELMTYLQRGSVAFKYANYELLFQCTPQGMGIEYWSITLTNGKTMFDIEEL